MTDKQPPVSMKELRQSHAMNLLPVVQEVKGSRVEVLGVSSMSKGRDNPSPRPGFTLHRLEHNGTPFWTVPRNTGSPPHQRRARKTTVMWGF